MREAPARCPRLAEGRGACPGRGGGAWGGGGFKERGGCCGDGRGEGLPGGGLRVEGERGDGRREPRREKEVEGREGVEEGGCGEELLGRGQAPGRGEGCGERACSGGGCPKEAIEGAVLRPSPSPPLPRKGLGWSW